MQNSPKVDSKSTKRRPPATTPEARENQLIALAMDLAEKRLRNGTATSQELTHFLKLGSTKEQKEQLLLEEEIALKKAKTKAIGSAEDLKIIYDNAIIAMSRYSGNGGNNDV